MSDEILTAAVKQFNANITLALQQKDTRLRAAVTEDTLKGEEGFFDSIGTVEMQELVSRHAPTPRTDTPHARRRVTSAGFVWSDWVDKNDLVQLLSDPTSKYVEAVTAAANRKIDSIIVTAARGTAYTGKAGTVAVALPASQKIAVNFGGSNCNVTIPKLVRAKGILWANEVPEDEEIHIAVRGIELEHMLMQERATSANYVAIQALINGDITRFLGLTWHRVESVPVASSVAYCPMWVKSGILLATGSAFETRVDELPGYNYSTQAWAYMNMGAARMDEKKVVEIACDESIVLALST
jgi:hypothetical protein